jgi:hypothetical protein
MFDDIGGPLWALIDVIAVAVLAAALVYGMMAWRRRRNRALEEVRDEATRKLFREEQGQRDS